MMRLIDKDTIYRQDAVEALKNAEPLVRDFGYYKVIETIRLLPSTEPKRPSEIQDILNYLDTVLHPIISPEHWNVYSELHDMISMLPSAQPERVWTPCDIPPKHHRDVIVRGVEAIGGECVYKVMQWDVDTWRPKNYAPSITWLDWSEI